MKHSLIIGLFVLCGISCKKKTDTDFDRGSLLNNMASSVIVPAFENTNSSLADLHAKAQNFTTTANASTLGELKADFLIAYKNFERCKMYNFGPLTDYGIKAAMNTYPTDTGKIETNIGSGSWTLGSAENLVAIGLPALDYLLFSADETTTINLFTTAPDADLRKTYLTDITQKMASEFQPVVDAWNGSYQSAFTSSDGTDIGSSASLLFNEFVHDIELLKNAKIGIPCGESSGGTPLPEMVEAYYSGYSKTLALENLAGLLNCFTGGSGPGFDDYITDVEGETEAPLAIEITDQFSVIQTKVNALGTIFSTDVMTNYTGFNAAYQEIKKLITFIKTDMASKLGLLITYSDSDGD